MENKEVFDRLFKLYVKAQTTICNVISKSRVDFDSGRRIEALRELWKLSLFETTALQRLYLAKLSLKFSKVCADAKDLETAIQFGKLSYSFSRSEPSNEAKEIYPQALLLMAKAFCSIKKWSLALISLDLLPKDHDPFTKEYLKLLILLNCQEGKVAERVDNQFVRCLGPHCFNSFLQSKQLMSLILSTCSLGIFDESTVIGHLFQEARKLKGITEVEKEESYSLEFIYYFERKDYFKAFQVLSAFIQTQNPINCETVDKDATPNAHFLRILDFSSDVGEKYLQEENFSEAQKWFAALVKCASELDGFTAARRILDGYKTAEPDNTAIKSMELELVLQYGDRQARKEVLEGLNCSELMKEMNSHLMTSILDFFANASKVEPFEAVAILESIIYQSTKILPIETAALFLKILIRMYTHLWSTDFETGNESVFISKLVMSLNQAVGKEYDNLLEFRRWIHAIGWNSGLLVKGLTEKFTFFGIAAKALPFDEKERLICYILQMSTGLEIVSNSIDQEKPTKTLEISEDLTNLSEEALSLLELLELSLDNEDFTEPRRMIAIFKLKLAFCTKIDLVKGVENVINQLKKDRDFNGLQLVLSQLINASSDMKPNLSMARVACMKAVIELLPTNTSAFPYCHFLLDELLSTSMDLLKGEVGKVVQIMIFICKNDRRLTQEQVFIPSAKLWNASIKYRLIEKEALSENLKQLSLALSEWAPSFQKVLKDKMKN